MALHRASRPRRTAETRSSSSSFSRAASCASHACNSDCAAPSLDEGPGGVKELREICDPSPWDEPSVLMKESRVGFWFLESLMRRVTLSPKTLSLAKAQKCGAVRGKKMNEQDLTVSYGVSNVVLEVFERTQLFLPRLDADRVTT